MASSKAFRLLLIFFSAIVLLFLVTSIQLSFSQYRKWIPRIEALEVRNAQTVERKTFSREDVETFQNLLKEMGLGRKPMNSEEELTAHLPDNTQLDNEQTHSLAEKDTNLAILYWDEWLNYTAAGSRLNVKAGAIYCKGVQLTSPFDVRQVNRYWQRFDALSTNKKEETIFMYLLNAYYDKRLDADGRPTVRLLTVNKQEPLGSKRKWWCMLWFDNIRDPVLVPVTDYYNIWPNKWRPHVKYGTYHPQILTCPLPVEHVGQVPRAASLQARGQCSQVERHPSNVLRVLNHQRDTQARKKHNFGICVQSFRFVTYDVSVRLIEWLEMMQQLGADKVYLYALGTTESLRKVLQYYEKKGLVEWRQFTLAGEQPNIEALYNLVHYNLYMNFWPQELIELNDCLYKNLYRHDYLAIVDIDEVIMPQRKANWQELIIDVEESLAPSELKQKAFYNSRQSHVCEVFEDSRHGARSIPPYLYMMRHHRRGDPLPYNKQNKCFIRTDLVTATHNHFPLRCLNTTGYMTCDGLTMDPEDSIMMHFRRNLSNPETAHRNWECPIEDRKVRQYYDAVQSNVRQSLQNIFN